MTFSLFPLLLLSLHGTQQQPQPSQPPFNHQKPSKHPPLTTPKHLFHFHKHQDSYLPLFQAQSECYFHPYADFCFWFLILLVFVSYFGCFSDGLCCFYGIKNHLVDGLWWNWNWMRLGLSSWLCKLLVQVMFIACFILVFAYLLIYWSLLCCYGVFEKLGVSSKWPKARVCPKCKIWTN